MREMTANEARLRSALEAALVALEVAADPANDIDPDGFATIARVCRATLEETGGVPEYSEPMIYCESLCCDNPCPGGLRQWPISAMRNGYCPECAPTRDPDAKAADDEAAEAARLDAEAEEEAARDAERDGSPEAALNPRDVAELSLGSIVPDTRREADARAATFFAFGGGA